MKLILLKRYSGKHGNKGLVYFPYTNKIVTQLLTPGFKYDAPTPQHIPELVRALVRKRRITNELYVSDIVKTQDDEYGPIVDIVSKRGATNNKRFLVYYVDLGYVIKGILSYNLRLLKMGPITKSRMLQSIVDAHVHKTPLPEEVSAL